MNRRFSPAAGLVPDCGGAIEEIAIAVVPACFTGDLLLRSLLSALGKFVETLPADVVLYVLAAVETKNQVAAWLSRLDLKCRPVLVQANLATKPDTSEFWVQDPLLVWRDGTDACFLQVECENPGDHAQWLGRRLGIPVERPNIYLAGGNLLVGPNFRLSGQDSIDLTQPLIDREGNEREGSKESAYERLARMDARPLLIAGYSFGSEPDGPPAAGAWNDPYRLRQYGGHVDRFISLTGLVTADGRPKIVVADAKLANGGRQAEFGSIPKMLDATATRLGQQGFKVIRNAVPFVPALRDRQLRPRLYNNVIVENEIRAGNKRPLVWLPQFADEEPWLAPFDAFNAGLWRGLGFEPVPALGWSKLTVAMGAVRCATKVLKRNAAFRFSG